MNDLAARFESNVDRSGEHHLWTAARDPVRGNGRLKVRGKNVTAHRVAWELAYGDLPSTARVMACPDEPACVRPDHLQVHGATSAGTKRKKSRRGSVHQIRTGVWKLTVSAGRYADGSRRRLSKRVGARNRREAERLLDAFADEVSSNPRPVERKALDLNMDQAIDEYLTEHLRDNKGREAKTIRDYRNLHLRWFSPEIGHKHPREVDEAILDELFGKMRRAGLSTSRLRNARCLYAPFFKWAKKRGMVSRSPMADFELPTSDYISRERVPPEVEELSLLLTEAVRVVPDVAPVLALGAVTGMRRGELLAIRDSRVKWREDRIKVDSAMDGHRVKKTKTRKNRSFHVDRATMAMLQRVRDQRDALAGAADIQLYADPFVFTRALDGSEPMTPDYVTKRVGILKEHLGIEDKRPETIEREDEALRLFRQPARPRPRGKTGPPPKGGMTYEEIGAHFGRSERWASLAVASAQRREATRVRVDQLDFDGSILALRKFTSSELLDAGFNISMVAQRQGHGPQVLAKHYSRSRRSADRKAAEHLGRIVHGPSAESASRADTAEP